MTNEFSDAEMDAGLAHVIACVKHKFNPFARAGITAAGLAYKMGYLTEKVTRAGHVCSNTQMAMRLLKALELDGKVVEAVAVRTMIAGSKHLKIWLPKKNLIRL